MNGVSGTRDVYVVVEVRRGVAVAAFGFASLHLAADCLARIRLDLSPDEDDAQLFVTRENELPEAATTSQRN